MGLPVLGRNLPFLQHARVAFFEQNIRSLKNSDDYEIVGAFIVSVQWAGEGTHAVYYFCQALFADCNFEPRYGLFADLHRLNPVMLFQRFFRAAQFQKCLV